MVSTAIEYNISKYGEFGGAGVDLADGYLEPSISLKSSVEVASGTGTYDDPYVIQ